MQFTFKIEAVRPLLEHTLKAGRHRALYGLEDTAVPGLWLVKDQGVYLMTNAEPGLRLPDGSGHHQVVYAEGFGPEEYMGGDDFAELIRAEWLTTTFASAKKHGRDSFQILLTATKLTLSV